MPNFIGSPRFRTLVYELSHDQFSPGEIAQLLVVSKDDVCAELKRKGRNLDGPPPMTELYWLHMYICAAEGTHRQGNYPKELQNSICQLIAEKMFRSDLAMAEARRRIRDPITFGLERTPLVWTVDQLFLSENARKTIATSGITHVWQLADKTTKNLAETFGAVAQQEIAAALHMNNLVCGEMFPEPLRNRLTAICGKGT